jgi:anti-sigma B factor antagonist
VTALVRISSEDTGSLVLVRLGGEVDASNAAWTHDRLRALIGNERTTLAIDLSAVSYLDSAGISVLYGLDAELRMHQQELRLIVPPESVLAKLLALAGLSAAVPTYGTADAARAAAPADAG